MSENEKKIYAFADSVQKSAVKAGNTVSTVAYMAGKKGEAVIGTAKLNMRLMDLRRKTDRIFQEIGGMVYATHIGAATDSDTLLKKLEEIDALKAEISTLETEAGKPVPARMCPTCGAEVKDTDTYCGECGGKLNP